MDYEKAYKEALKRAKGFKTDEYRDVAKYIFPELSESEDEKIRKEIMDIIDSFEVAHLRIAGLPTRIPEYLAWLEKQVENNPYSGVSFKYNGHTWGMCARDNGVDILLDKQLFKHLEKQGEQKNAWSEEDETNLRRTEYAVMKFFGGDCSLVSWMRKSLKDRIQPKQEILEKLKEWLDEYISDLADVDTASLICSFTNYLDGKLPKSLRPQNTWKPSDEQIKILNEVLNFSANHESPHWNDYIFGTLSNLIRQLKRLREE